MSYKLIECPVCGSEFTDHTRTSLKDELIEKIKQLKYVHARNAVNIKAYNSALDDSIEAINEVYKGVNK